MCRSEMFQGMIELPVMGENVLIFLKKLIFNVNFFAFLQMSLKKCNEEIMPNDLSYELVNFLPRRTVYRNN